MAGKRPAIESRQGHPRLGIGDDIARALIKAVGGAAGKAKKNQGRKIVSRIAKSDPVKAQMINSKAGRLSGQFARSSTKRRGMAETERMAKAHMQRMKSKNLNWDGSPRKKGK